MATPTKIPHEQVLQGAIEIADQDGAGRLGAGGLDANGPVDAFAVGLKAMRNGFEGELETCFGCAVAGECKSRIRGRFLGMFAEVGWDLAGAGYVRWVGTIRHLTGWHDSVNRLCRG